jgi:hypothetical protein
MIQNYDKIWRWNAKFSKIFTSWKIHIYRAFIQQWLRQNMWYIGETVFIFNNKLQNISFKIRWKSEKRLKWIHSLFVK